jgi:protein-tyrosine phosphatase
MAEVVLQHFVDADSSLRGYVDVTSAGTANWHVGSPMDQRARGALDRAGFNGAGSLAAYADRAYLDRQDVVIGMTREHVHEVKKRLSNPSTEVILLRNLMNRGVTSTCSILTTATTSSSTSVSRQSEQGVSV